jgi:23S rRNA pseudouridine1911/1915/1917 synthase
VVGDHLYGAPHKIPNAADPDHPLLLERNFLHAAHLSFTHPQTGKPMDLNAPLPPELADFLETLRAEPRVSIPGRT